ncbi:malto-oligosyltrehalose synthase [Achromobacter sp. B7]|uniref:malto-oligosyltrehalose synthase n=1 Tax=Achromobacter sp. B7 TaxID=2282475 RepID=UPI000E71271B|nr:malto-oligosyltrehalose synthase [Achromobacter sp. B7]AYD64872.1 malto-oligosyltrehalose synthase [Achromobacter sp. B7]
MKPVAPPIAPSIPRATARLQLHADFTLDDARRQLPYYAALGVSHLYLSPITQAKAGSTHGYDVIDHQRVSDDLGGESALRKLADAARAHGMGLIADIVPNHMAAHASNAWWADVLRLGRQSAQAGTFDINWDAPDPLLRGKVLLPVLPDPYSETLAAGGIRLVHDAQSGTSYIEAGGQQLPLTPGSATGDPATLCAACDPGSAAGQARLHALLERQHYRLAWWRTAPDLINWRRFFEISELVGVRVEDEAVFNAVHALVLRLYREGVLDGLRIDHIDGLASPGAYLRRLRRAMREADDARSQAGLPGEGYLVIEKILADDEALEPHWPTHGTTGYDFMDQVGALLHAPQAQAPLEQFWASLSRDARDAPAQLRDARHRMLARHFPSERLALVTALARIAHMDARTRDWTQPAIDRVLTALLAAFPVYRTYAEDGGRSPADTHWCRIALDQARAALGDASADLRLLDQLDHWLGGGTPPSESATPATSATSATSATPSTSATPAPAAAAAAIPGADSADAPDSQQAEARTLALRRFQQLTPPLAAKALEDTLFYRRGPLLSRNEVGSSPTRFTLPLEEFHALCAARAGTHPHAMLATATHDHKRGEDTRARLAVLSEIPDEWRRTADGWIARLAPPGPPTPADRYLLLQSLVGAWPLSLSPERLSEQPEAIADFLGRIAQWQEKALREAKLHTSWTDPNADYEGAARRCIEALQQPGDGQALLRDIGTWALKIASAGLVNSLTQTVLRNTVPGVPDLYQGADLWDFSLVDPDNRRPVDYAERAALLAESNPPGTLEGDATDATATLQEDARPDVLAGHVDTPIATDAQAWRSGAIKQSLIQRALALRARHPDVFRLGDYTPLAVHGPRAANVIAYLRRHDGRCVVVVAPRLCAMALAGYAQGKPAQAAAYWEGTRVALPADVDADMDALRDVLSGRRPSVNGAGELALDQLLRDGPVALLATE